MSTIDPTWDPDEPLALPVPTDPDEIREELVTAIRQRVPDWADVDTSILTHVLAAIAEVAGEARQAMQDRVADELAELLGELFRNPPNEGTQASGSITVTAADALGHTEPAGLTVWIGDVELVTTTDIVVTPGNTTGTAQVSAVEPGAQANGATGTPEIDPLDWIASDTPIVLDAPLSGGTDPEDPATYRVRLIEEAPTVTRRPILPEDFAIRARSHPAVFIAWAITGYDASTNTPDVPLTGTVVVADEDGRPLSWQVEQDVLADLTGATGALLNLDIHVVPPTYTELGATGTVRVRDGWDAADVCQAVEDRLTMVLSPAGWVAGWYGELGVQAPDRRVHVNELIAQADQVEGVEHVATMTLLDDQGDPIVGGYVDLSRPDGLPEPGTITITAAS
ncbi:MAG: baseplate J/gp47 family protein [Solirubrobacteraceae bacterium]|nr:baseplate J/gp47 family protein [Solirubrobacteraceae bacterium]